MADRKGQIVKKMVELSKQEQKQAQGGANVFLKFGDTYAGDATSASLSADYVVWRKTDGTQAGY
jgi:hypothetical protein